MNKIDVYVQAGTAEEAKCFKIAEDATVGDLIQCVEAEGVAIGLLEEEIALLVEEKETLVKRAHKLSECGIRHGHHVDFRKRHHKRHGHVHHEPRNINLTIVVNGTPTKIEADVESPLGSVIPKALEQTGNEGQPPGNWELKDAKGVVLDITKTIQEFHFPCDTTLFLSLKAGIGG
jgi:hypothetical protein